jgi:curved DNA-binding protein CbpA
MNRHAFRILGIAPTDDGRAIRTAFLRLAKIYHPDRFVGQPDDVREEAERRMKEATVAYESLRGAKKPQPEPDEEIDESEVHNRAMKYRETAAKRREKEKLDRERWSRWERVEEIARKKAKLEADMAARVADEVDESGVGSNGSTSSEPRPVKPPGPMTRDALAERLNAARRGEESPLVKRN